MLTVYFDLVTSLFDPPFYIFKQEGLLLTCSKLHNPKDGKFSVTTYRIVEGKQCTCMSFMKVGNCKHLKMLADDYSWIMEGVPWDYAIEVLDELIKKCGDSLPKSAADWNVDSMKDGPEYVAAMELGIKDKLRRQPERLIAFKKLPGKRQLAIVFKFKGEE